MLTGVGCAVHSYTDYVLLSGGLNVNTRRVKMWSKTVFAKGADTFYGSGATTLAYESDGLRKSYGALGPLYSVRTIARMTDDDCFPPYINTSACRCG